MSLADVDFLHQPGQPVAAWWLLAAGALCLAGSIAAAQHSRDELEAASLQARTASDAHQARLRPAPAAQPTLAQRRWRQAQPELAQPWLAALRAIESATHEPVYLLSLTIDPSTGAVRLEGEAPGFDRTLAYVQALTAETALSSVTLESHAEASAASTGAAAVLSPPATAGAPHAEAPVVRFSILAHWRRP